MKRLFHSLIVTLLMASSGKTIELEVHQQCLKAADYQGCVSALEASPLEASSQAEKGLLLAEISKIADDAANKKWGLFRKGLNGAKERLEVLNTRGVGEDLFASTNKLLFVISSLSAAADTHWEESTYIFGEAIIEPSYLASMKKDIDDQVGGGDNVIGISCEKRFMGILNGGNKEIGENPLLQLGALVEDMSRQIAANGVFVEYSNPDSSKSLFPAPPKDGRECSTDPFLELYPVPEDNSSKSIRGRNDWR